MRYGRQGRRVSVSMDGQDFFIPVGTKRLTYDFSDGRHPFSGIYFHCRNRSYICPLGIIEWWLVPERRYFHEGLQSELAIDEMKYINLKEITENDLFF